MDKSCCLEKSKLTEHSMPGLRNSADPQKRVSITHRHKLNSQILLLEAKATIDRALGEETDAW